MQERPINLLDWQVLAALDGRKTRHTVPVNPQPDFDETKYEHGFWSSSYETPDSWEFMYRRHDGRFYPVNNYKIKSPFGVVGDRLYVRETWAPARVSESYEYGDVCYFKWDEWLLGKIQKDEPNLAIFYRADGEDNLPAEFSMPHGNEIPWHPSIHMPHWASRITLEITLVRIERLQEITGDGVLAEGIEFPEASHYIEAHRRFDFFRDLWDSIYAKRGLGWDSNPWVWVIEFRRVNP